MIKIIFAYELHHCIENGFLVKFEDSKKVKNVGSDFVDGNEYCGGRNFPYGILVERKNGSIR
jgi:hypothetical protein